MERKLKGWKGPSWTEYLVRYKDRRGISWRDIARECDMSDASWHAMATGKGPPNYDRAKQVATAALPEMPTEAFLNIIFKDRLLRWAKIEGILRKPPTPTIERFLESILRWDPTEDEGEPRSKKNPPIGYIMSTSASPFGTEFANDSGGLLHGLVQKCGEKRSDGVRVGDFQHGDVTARGGFSGHYA